MLSDDQPATDAGSVEDALASRAHDATLVLTELSGLLVEDTDVDSTLQRVVDVAVRVIHGCDAAGVTITAGGQPRTAVWTDERTLPVDADQYAAGEGPCLEAAATQRTQRVDIAEALRRWPAFGRAAEQDGIRSFLAAPLVVKGESLGSLNLYSRATDGFGPLDETFVLLLSGQASAAVANSLRYEEMRTLTGQLEEALLSRAVIEQAKGVLIALHGVDAEQAFGLLRRRSQQTNVKLRDVATDVVERALAARAMEGERAV